MAFLYLFWHTQTVFIALLLSHKYYSFALLWPGWEEWKTLEDFLSGFQGQFPSVEELETFRMERVYYIDFGKWPTVEDLAPEHF